MINIMIGLPGSGKSYLAKKLAEENDGIVVSSDSIREELYGDESIQGNGSEVFSLMFKRVLAAHKENRVVYYDATNINRKRRIALVNSFIQKGVKRKDISFIVVATSFEKCLENNGNRARKVPKEVLYRMRENFEPLSPDECDNFERALLSYPFKEKNIVFSNDEISKNKIPHDNPHHTLDIADHMIMAGDYAKENVGKREEVVHKMPVIFSACLHDIGKVDTKKLFDAKGKLSEKAHYYNHENVGAYKSLFCNYSDNPFTIFYCAALIGYHMLPYSYHIKDISVVKEKLLLKFHDNVFVDELLFVHEADLAAH